MCHICENPHYLAKARQALEFAQLHDWGRDAYLVAGGSEREPYIIAGLVDAYTQLQPDGSVTYHEETKAIAATIEALRDFGNY